jgi:C4-dicarboxylate-specific signal transduction histidine kinase
MPILAPNGTFVRETTDHLAKNTLTNTVSAPRPMPNDVPVPHFPAPRLAHRAGLPHLLVVEDHQELLHFLHDVLVDDYNVTLAGDGAAALEAALACPPDLVITDLMMPQVDGMQLMQALRRMTQFEQVPAIVLTARADDAVRDNLLEECVQDYLTKPFSPQELRARVRNLITVKRSVELLQSELVRVSRFTAMGELAASIAHEVNQPLSAIATNSQAALRWMSRDTPNLPEVVAALNRVYRDANLAGDVIARIRNFLSRGGIKHERIAVQQILYDLLRMLHTLFQQASVEITVLVSPALPHLNADKVQLQQVLLNLIVNAVEAMREHSKGPRLLSISVTEQATQGMVFSVCDNGPGVPADIRPHLFEALFSTKSDGLGMGLAISRSIVENHGGWLRLDPNHSPGACFCFNIPLLP